MDIDVTVKGFTLAETETKVIIKNITEINLNDDVEFEWKRCEEIRDDDVYGGLRVFLNGYFDSKSMVVPFSIDISTGDVITPEPPVIKIISPIIERPILLTKNTAILAISPGNT